jgi:nuclear pore complex protein Nup62
MDEILTTWSTSLAQHQKTFASLAQQVSAWDRMLVENAGKITSLYGRCFQAERDVAEVERQLSGVEHGQVELESVLERYEGWVDEILESEGVGEVGGVDGERERTYATPPLSQSLTANYYAYSANRYKSAELCATRLTDMGHSLSSMIEEINVASGKLGSNANSAATAAQRQDDPLAQIVRVLNGHLQQLQTIDSGAAELGRKVEQAQKEARSLEHGQGIRDQGWVEGFGRSYLGRS